MKKFNTILLAAVALFAFVPVTRAQSINDIIKDKDGSTLRFEKQKSNYTIDNEEGKVAYRKSVSSPLSDGTYYIKLETFATGSAQKMIKSTPSDIILVLDLSSSMTKKYHPAGQTEITRLDALKTAVTKFVKTVYDNNYEALGYDTNYERDRIAIISYNRNANFVSNNGWVFIDDPTNGIQKNQDTGAYSGALLNAINGMNSGSGTRPDHGLDMAIDRLLSNGQSKRSNANLTVLVFTDGYPTDDRASSGNQGEGTGTDAFEYSFANKTLYYGSKLKDLGAKIYSVGLISTMSQDHNDEYYRNYCRVLQMLDWLSSNYPNAKWVEGAVDESEAGLAIDNKSTNNNYYNGYNSNSSVKTGNAIPSPWNTVWNYSSGNISLGENFVTGSTTSDGNKFTSDGYSQVVDDNTNFDEIFEAIAQQTAGTANPDLSSSTSNVDIVSNSFILPDGLLEDGAVVKDYVKVFTAKLLDITGATDPDMTNGTYNFDTEILAPNNTYQYTTYDAQGNPTGLADIDDGIEIELVGENGINVVGFDYASNFCGPVYKANSSTVDHYNGHKIIILIPIKMNPDAVGGPNVVTNADGSGIYTENSGTTPLIEFVSPTVSLPVNVYIEKIGLTGRESAKFKIERAIMPDEVDEDWNPATDQSLDWAYVSTVFVTNSPTTEKSTSHEIVVVNEDGTEKKIVTSGNPMVRVKGMPSTLEVVEGGEKVQKPLIYRISEEPWSWSYDPQTPPQYTVTSKLDNPFTFINKEFENSNNLYLEDHRHAESKVMNIFNTGTNKRFDDSKTNTGRESSGPGGLNTTTNP